MIAFTAIYCGTRSLNAVTPLTSIMAADNSIRALKFDLEAFDARCRRHKRIALPATPELS